MTRIPRLLGCSSSLQSGGSERQMVNLLRGLDRRRYQPQLYLLYNEGILRDEIPDDVPIEAFWDRHRLPRIRWPGRVLGQQIRDLTKLIRRSHIDLLYDRLFHMAMIAGPAARQAGVPRVSTIVSPPTRDLLTSERRFVWFKRRALARAYRQADRLIAVSQGTAEDAAQFYRIDLSRFEIIPNPIDLGRVDRLQDEPWEGIQPNSLAKILVSVGRLSEEKGHTVLIDAIAPLIRQSTTPIELHLIGDGPLRYPLEQQASLLGIREQVVFHGQVANPFPLLRKAHLFVLPSLYEGLPNALLEALACQVPAIASNCPGGIQEVSQGGKFCRLVPPGDAAALHRAISEHLDPRRSGDSVPLMAARQHVEQHHSLERWLRHMETVFDAVRDKSPFGSPRS